MGSIIRTICVGDRPAATPTLCRLTARSERPRTRTSASLSAWHRSAWGNSEPAPSAGCDAAADPRFHERGVCASASSRSCSAVGPLDHAPCIRQRLAPRTAGALQGALSRGLAFAPHRGALCGSPKGLPWGRTRRRSGRCGSLDAAAVFSRSQANRSSGSKVIPPACGATPDRSWWRFPTAHNRRPQFLGAPRHAFLQVLGRQRSKSG